MMMNTRVCYNCGRYGHVLKYCTLPINFCKMKDVDNYLKMMESSKYEFIEPEELLKSTIKAFSLRDDLLAREEFESQEKFFVRDNLFKLRIYDTISGDIRFEIFDSSTEEELLEQMTDDEKTTIEILKNIEIEKITNRYIINSLRKLKLIDFIDEDEFVKLSLSNTPYEFYSLLNLEQLQFLGW